MQSRESSSVPHVISSGLFLLLLLLAPSATPPVSRHCSIAELECFIMRKCKHSMKTAKSIWWVTLKNYREVKDKSDTSNSLLITYLSSSSFTFFSITKNFRETWLKKHMARNLKKYLKRSIWDILYHWTIKVMEKILSLVESHFLD